MAQGGSRIRILPDAVANQIAAGEVVERPASVLKELIENALDARASNVSVELVAGGRRLIVVQDDGMGMCRDDVLLSIERHATSKIHDAGDLARIATMGFRGEALAAICSVSRLEIVSRTRSEPTAVRLTASAGKILSVEECGAPCGTRVAVRDLFFNVPARRKFMRSERTEAALLRQMFIAYALAFPELSFSLRLDGRETYRLAAVSGFAERIRLLFGEDLFRQLFSVTAQKGDVNISGYAGHPVLSRRDRGGQFVFVNRRPVQSPLLAAIIREAYSSILEKDRHPTVFLHVELPPEEVDVNVHPTKKEVRFRHPQQVRDILAVALQEALAGSHPGRTGSGITVSFPRSAGGGPSSSERPTPTGSLKPFPYARIPLEVSTPESGSTSPVAQAPPDMPSSAQPSETTGTAPWKWFRVLGSIAGGRYVAMETDQGLVLMDQHAAHERVVYEELMRDFSSDRPSIQGLLTPETVSLSPADADNIRRSLAVLRRMGFDIEEFGADTLIINGLPAILPPISIRTLLLDVASALQDAGRRAAERAVIAELVAKAACRSAVRTGEYLSEPEIERLVVRLAESEMPYTCPHGRPTLIMLSFRELDRKFGRA